MASLKDVKFCFEAVNTANVDALIRTIRALLNREKPEKTPAEWIAFIDSGDKFLSFVDEQKEKFGEKVDLFKSDSQVLGVISGILEEVGKAHWAVAGLSMIGHLLSKLRQMSENQDECLNLLKDMLNLAEHIKKLEPHLPQQNEKLTDALVTIVKGSMLCAKQLNSKNHKKLFRFLKSSLDSTNLSTLRSKIDTVYKDLALTVVIENLDKQQQPHRPVSQPECPAHGVGLEDREREVEKKLHMDPTDESFMAVVIYGFGGIGKTHLAKAVYFRLWSKQILKGYNHARVLLDMDPKKNDFVKKQQQILMDAFPNYNSGETRDLRDTEDGKSCLRKAFEESSKPVFLFIDNVQRLEDLNELLPNDLGRLPTNKHIRLLLTARTLKATDMFSKHRRTYPVRPLPNCDALKILCSETENLNHIKQNVHRILKICDGVPLALKIVGAELDRHGYMADKCDELLNALEKGETIIEQDLTKRMVEFVYEGLEDYTKEAFLDICCFFNGTHRTLVESTVGAGPLRDLEDAALITARLEKEYYAPMQENEMIVVVHDVIRNIGQKKAKDTRITDIKRFKAIVKDKMLETVRGIDLWHDNEGSPYELTKEQLRSMSESLRVLKLGMGMKIKYKSNIPFPELRYVYLHENIRYLPFNLNKLDKLAVYEGPLLKGGVSIANLPQSLRHVRTLHSDGQYKYWEHKSKETPESRLHELMLKSFPMKTVPAGLKDFSSLRTLWLEDWYEMEQFSEVICELHWLTTLSLVKCRFRRLPESFGNLASLTNLSLEGCDTLEEMPSTLGMLKATRYINLKRCTSLKSLPWTFGELTALEGLNIMKCALLIEIPGFKKLTRLRYLNIQDCARQLGHDCRNVHRELQIEDKGSDDEDLSYLSRRPSLDIRYTSKGKWSVVVGSVVIFSFSRYLYYQMSGKIELYLIR